MKRKLQWLLVAVAACSLNSCGIPGMLGRSAEAVGRSAGRMVEGAGNMLGPAAAAATAL